MLGKNVRKVFLLAVFFCGVSLFWGVESARATLGRLACFAVASNHSVYSLVAKQLPTPFDFRYLDRASSDKPEARVTVRGNTLVYLLQAQGCVEPEEAAMLWFTFAARGPEISGLDLKGDLIARGAEEVEFFVVLVESASWTAKIRVHSVRAEVFSNLRMTAFEKRAPEDWPVPDEPIAKTEIRLTGQYVRGPKAVDVLLMDGHLRIFIEKGCPEASCPVTETALDLDTLEWKSLGQTAADTADFLSSHRDNVGERLSLCVIYSDEGLETRLSCARRLGEMQYLPAIKRLVSFVDLEDPTAEQEEDRYPAAWALSQFGMAAVPEIVRTLLSLQQRKPRVREILLEILRADKIRREVRVYVAGVSWEKTVEDEREMAKALLEEL